MQSIELMCQPKREEIQRPKEVENRTLVFLRVLGVTISEV